MPGRDLVQAWRGLRKRPVLVLVAVSSLALGIGFNLTIYSIARELIIDDLSARDPGRLAALSGGMTTTQYRELKGAGIFQDLAFDTGLSNSEWETGGHKEIAWDITTSANFF